MIFGLIERIRGYLMPSPFWVRSLGPRGEYLVRRHYHRRGYHCLEKNWRHGSGELDLIMANRRHVLVIEVKSRTVKKQESSPQHWLKDDQQRRLLKLAKIYINGWPGEVPWQFKPVLVLFRGKKCQILT